MAELFSRKVFHSNVVGGVDGHVDDEEVEQEVGGSHVLLGGLPGKEGAEANVDAEGGGDEDEEWTDSVNFAVVHVSSSFHRFVPK